MKTITHTLDSSGFNDLQQLSPKCLAFLYMVKANEVSKEVPFYYDDSYQGQEQAIKIIANQPVHLKRDKNFLTVTYGDQTQSFFRTKEQSVVPLDELVTIDFKKIIEDPLSEPSKQALFALSEFIKLTKGNIPSYNQMHQGCSFKVAEKRYGLNLPYDIMLDRNNKQEIVVKFVKAQKTLGDGTLNDGVHPISYYFVLINGVLEIKDKKPKGERELVKLGRAERLRQEYNITSAVRGANATFFCPVAGVKAQAAMSMPRYEGSTLQKVIEQELAKEEPTKQKDMQHTLAVELIDEIVELHKKIVHRDIKSDNTIVTLGSNDEVENVKVFDFGLSDLLSHENKRNNYGTPTYMAPEVLAPLFYSQKKIPFPPNTFGKVTRQQDIWSLAVLLIEIFTASPIDDYFKPHTAVNLEVLTLMYNIFEHFKDKVALNFSEEFRTGLVDLLGKMLDLDWNKRPDINEVKEEFQRILVLEQPKQNIDTPSFCMVL